MTWRYYFELSLVFFRQVPLALTKEYMFSWLFIPIPLGVSPRRNLRPHATKTVQEVSR